MFGYIKYNYDGMGFNIYTRESQMETLKMR
jgi:hypothetical protein